MSDSDFFDLVGLVQERINAISTRDEDVLINVILHQPADE